MTNEKTKYMEKLAKFVIGEEVKLKRTKGEKVKIKPLGVGHLSEAKGQSVKTGKREYASGTISKAEEDEKGRQSEDYEIVKKMLEDKNPSGSVRAVKALFDALLDCGQAQGISGALDIGNKDAIKNVLANPDELNKLLKIRYESPQ